MKRLILALLLLPSLARANYDSVISGDHPARWFKFAEPNGTTATDSGGSPTNATYQGTFTLGQAGLVGTSDTAVKWDGSTGFLAPGGSPAWDFDVTNGVTTMQECWFKGVVSGPGGTILAKGDSSANTAMYGYFDNEASTNSVQLVVYGSACNGGTTIINFTGTSLTVGQYHYLAVIGVGAGGGQLSSVKAFIDATNVAQNLTNQTVCASAGATNIGRRANTGSHTPYDGTETQCAFYSTNSGSVTPTAAMVTAHYNAGITVPDVHRYRPFTSQRGDWLREHVVPVSLIERHGAMLAVDEPTFVLDRLNARAVTAEGQYAQ